MLGKVTVFINQARPLEPTFYMIKENIMTNEEMMKTVACDLDSILVKLSEHVQDTGLKERNTIEGRQLITILNVLSSAFDITEFRHSADAMNEIAEELKAYGESCEEIASMMEGK